MCVYVCACICGKRERESNHEQTVCGASGSNLGGTWSFLDRGYYAHVGVNFHEWCVCVCTPVNLIIHLFLWSVFTCILFFLVCVCMCVRAFVERERATMNKLYASLPDPTWEGTLDLFGSGLLCPCKLNFMCVCVCVCVHQSIYV